MLKKFLIGGLAGSLLLGGGMYLGLGSYARTAWNRAHAAAKDSVPVSFEIDRARDLIKDLVPEIRRNMHLIAQEEIELARLDEQISGGEQKLARDRDEMVRLTSDLKEGRTVYRYAGRSYTAGEVKSDLTVRFARFQTSEATLESLKQMKAAREKSLAAARRKLEGMLSARRDLEVQLEQLEARLKMVEAAQTTSNYNFDDSRLSQAKELIQDLRGRLDVAERLLNAEGAETGSIILDEVKGDEENIVEEVTEYFQRGSTESKLVEATSDAP
jgi:hypothetical protein